MSRYSFEEIITNTESLKPYKNDLTDIKGFTLCDWISYGIIGWDEDLNTYFIQLDIDTDEIPWWIGVSSKEIPTFDSLCDIICRIFRVKDGFFKFTDPLCINAC